MKTSNDSRRDFIKKTIAGTAALSLGGILPGFTAKSYGNILGANERIKVSVMGVNSRGLALAQNFASQPNAEVLYVADVDSRAIEKCSAAVEKIAGNAPKSAVDFRKTLEDKDIDALVVAEIGRAHV